MKKKITQFLSSTAPERYKAIANRLRRRRFSSSFHLTLLGLTSIVVHNNRIRTTAEDDKRQKKFSSSALSRHFALVFTATATETDETAEWKEHYGICLLVYLMNIFIRPSEKHIFHDIRTAIVTPENDKIVCAIRHRHRHLQNERNNLEQNR